MVDVSKRNRKAAGSPEGGRFAEEAKRRPVAATTTVEEAWNAYLDGLPSLHVVERCNLAREAGQEADVLARLACDTDFMVLRAVANHPATETTVLETLERDEDEETRLNARHQLMERRSYDAGRQRILDAGFDPDAGWDVAVEDTDRGQKWLVIQNGRRVPNDVVIDLSDQRLRCHYAEQSERARMVARGERLNRGDPTPVSAEEILATDWRRYVGDEDSW